jgi:hypothetical protein
MALLELLYPHNGKMLELKNAHEAPWRENIFRNNGSRLHRNRFQQ